MSEDAVEYETRVTQLFVGPKGDHIYNELGFVIEITDEGGGEFVEVSPTTEPGKIRIDSASWPTLRDAIERLLGECREDA
jgi:hypothetical protein